MPEPLTDEQLDEIEARANAATPGPWHWEDWAEDDGDNRFALVAPPETRPGGPSEWFPDLGHLLIQDEDHNISEQDRAFIAHAREDVPRLIAELRAARQMNAALAQALKGHLQEILRARHAVIKRQCLSP